MSDQVGADQREARAGGRGRRKVGLRTSLAGLSVAGVAAAVLLTTAAAGVQGAAAAESSTSMRGATTSTVTSSSAAGSLTVQVKYVSGPKGGIKIDSVTYSGGANVKVSRPALMFTFGPAGPMPPAPGQRKVHKNKRAPAFFVVLRLKVTSAASFSGALPARLLATLNKHGGLRLGPFGGESVSVTLTSGGQVTHRRQITLHPVIQAGLLLSGI
ncbi:MAG TPA: hypothetical protein VLX31_09460 [Streptosporangiaceae bacterium]|nr:hypothetical protein [Streptosporangiaceae bacterium]